MLHHDENGSALVAVLCLIFSAGIITAVTLALSKTSYFTVSSHVALQRSMLVGEGIANRIQFLIAADRNLNGTDETLGDTEYDNFEYDRLLPDGVIHTLDYYGEKVDFTIHDTISGWDLSADGYETSLKLLATDEDATEETRQLLTEIQERIADYIDSDNECKDNGMESDDYTDVRAAPLPRNAAMAYREELLYIKDFGVLFPVNNLGRASLVRLISNDSSIDLGGTPSLFNVDKRMLKFYCGLDDNETDNAMDAINKWTSNREPLADNLDEELLGKLNKLSRQNSNIYTITITPSKGTDKIFRRLIFTYCPYDVQGPDNDNIQYLQWHYL